MVTRGDVLGDGQSLLPLTSLVCLGFGAPLEALPGQAEVVGDP